MLPSRVKVYVPISGVPSVFSRWAKLYIRLSIGLCRSQDTGSEPPTGAVELFTPRCEYGVRQRLTLFSGITKPVGLH